MIYEISTHRALPGWIVSAHGGLGLERHDVGGLPSRTEGDVRHAVGDEHVYVEHAVLFPNLRGKPAVLCAGTAKRVADREPVVARVDGGDSGDAAGGAKRVWRAQPAAKPSGLVMLEAPGRLRLFIVTTDGGELLLLDDDGGLRARVRMPRPEANTITPVYALAAGPLGEDGWAIAVRLLRGTWVYRVHPEKLPPR